MATPGDLKFTKSHEWVKVDGDIATIGVTDYAQNELGDITYVELPEPGSMVSPMEAFGIVESVKAANDINAPIGGEVLEVNSDVLEHPEVINAAPYGDAWLIKVKLANAADLEALMSAIDYDEFAASEAH